ncbi:MAG: hypothetical protein WBF38_07110 [Nitrosotalea sp.]
MQQKVDINSFLVTKLKDEHCSFIKYDIEASIDEVESEEDHIKLKYKFILHSNPTNVKLSIDGFTTIYGNQQDMAKHLCNDERNIPRIVNAIYQEIFPFLYITSKTMQIPCPAYRLADIAKARQSDVTPTLAQVEKNVELEPSEDTKLVDNPVEIENQVDIETEIQESLIQEQKISTV